MAEPQKPVNPDVMRTDECQMSEAEIDYEMMESFPASDPPSWTLGLKRRPDLPRCYDGERPSAEEPSRPHQQ